jgi:hypothetical protein
LFEVSSPHRALPLSHTPGKMENIKRKKISFFVLYSKKILSHTGLETFFFLFVLKKSNAPPREEHKN